MYALVDCNSFFCSVEKVFHPGLEGKPVCVLSNNDGCIVALTPEAKAVGLHRGDPIFKVQDIVNRHGVKVFSTNMQLYAAMSRRVTRILRRSVLHVENYSIDESFCDLHGYEAHHDLVEFMREVRDRIRLWTDIPVSVGIAPSKTLAKMGAKFAKQYKGYQGGVPDRHGGEAQEGPRTLRTRRRVGYRAQDAGKAGVPRHTHAPGVCPEE